MKLFINRVFKFLILLVLVIAATFFLNKRIVDSLLEMESVLPNNTKWLAIGDSHITNSINPNDYPWIQNRAHSGERLYYNYEKLKFYINKNPQIDLVIIGYWFGSLSYDMDWLLYGKDSKYRYESYLPIMIINNTDINFLNVPKNRKLFYENYFGYKYGYPSPSVRLMVKNYFTFNKNLEMRGGFLYRNNIYKPNLNKRLPEKIPSQFSIDSLPLKNLRDIVSFLKEKGVKIIFYNTPVTNDFFTPKNHYAAMQADSLISTFVDEKSVWYINHSRLSLPNRFFNDKHHLNTNGANYITPILVDSITKLIN